MFWGSITGRNEICLFCEKARPSLGDTKSPIQWVPELFTKGQSDRGVKLTTHLRLALKSRMSGAIPPHPK